MIREGKPSAKMKPKRWALTFDLGNHKLLKGSIQIMITLMVENTFTMEEFLVIDYQQLCVL